jgi:hypothetical protein
VSVSPTAIVHTPGETTQIKNATLPQRLEFWNTIEEPTVKKRRIDNDWTDPGSYAFGNIDPFLSPATASSWPFDEFAHDPDYLASQEALRSLLFTTARSAAPTRAGTPNGSDDLPGAVNIKQVLATGRHVLYMKNFMAQVAPWVSTHCIQGKQWLTDSSSTCSTANVLLAYSYLF